jgi:hypothetical protein
LHIYYNLLYILIKGESVHAFFTINLLEADGSDTKQCKLCLKKIQLNKMRLHVAQHILLQKEEERKSNTCGFCGGLSCITKLVVTSGSGERSTYSPHSNCIYYFKFSLKPSKKGSKRSPCTNRPFECQLCNLVFWTYNLKQHYKEKHVLNIAEALDVSEYEKEQVLMKKFI